MTIIVDSLEYKCWHEIGHATVCLDLGGDVSLIEFLVENSRGYARTRSVVTPEIHKSVACGGFAAEVLLLHSGWSQRAIIDIRETDDIIWHNATGDREDFRGRRLGRDESFTDDENRAFKDHAFAHALPILYRYLPGMRAAVAELHHAKRLEGRRVRELLGSAAT